MYYLVGLLIAAVGLSAAGDMHYSAIQIAISASVLVLSCWLINKVFAYIFYAPVNPESSILTGLILALIIPPSLGNFGFLFLLAASGLAIASKYILTLREKHIFNPAAIAIVLTALGPRQNATWWVGTAVMLPFVLAGGILITRKVRREYMVGSFLIASTIATLAFAIIGRSSLPGSLHNMILSSPLFFLGFVMLSEPYTSPTTKNKQIVYASLVGILLAPQFHLGHFYTSPEIALVAGNIFAYIVSSKTKLFPILRNKIKIAQDTVEFAFIPDRKLAYKPGQYMEWTLPHDHADSRGSRRWFTLASSPTEDQLRLGIKFYDEGSSFKAAMLDMDQNTPIVAAQIAGDFVMPHDTDKKLVFIAGGIGITPFRSMIKYLIDTGQQRSVRLLYSARTEADFAYKDVFDNARQNLGIKTLYVVSDKDAVTSAPNTVPGIINADLIMRYIPDYADCMFYISGTHPMVEAIQDVLHQLGVSHHHIKSDFFPGYA
jgi:ferredoxin-NADP reductase/Na+-translocating ferredoxin:NAD+ oxidoreductase RnfD subunit